MARADVLKKAMLEYHAGKITFAELARCLREFGGRVPHPG